MPFRIPAIGNTNAKHVRSRGQEQSPSKTLKRSQHAEMQPFHVKPLWRLARSLSNGMWRTLTYKEAIVDTKATNMQRGWSMGESKGGYRHFSSLSNRRNGICGPRCAPSARSLLGHMDTLSDGRVGVLLMSIDDHLAGAG